MPFSLLRSDVMTVCFSYQKGNISVPIILLCKSKRKRYNNSPFHKEDTDKK
jgi:hypothetical protein